MRIENIQIELNKIKVLIVALDRVLNFREKLTSEERNILESFFYEIDEIKKGN